MGKKYPPRPDRQCALDQGAYSKHDRSQPARPAGLVRDEPAVAVAKNDVNPLVRQAADAGAQPPVKANITPIHLAGGQVLAQSNIGKTSRLQQGGAGLLVATRHGAKMRQGRLENPFQRTEAADQALGDVGRVLAREGGEEVRHDRYGP